MRYPHFTVQLLKRDFTGRRTNPGWTFTVRRYGHGVIGGPLESELTVTGSEESVWTLLDTLRCPVEIYDHHADLCWWGYVGEVTVGAGDASVGVSLEDMANTVYVVYSYVPPGSNTVGTRATTTAAVDSLSVALYGTKTLRHSLDGATPAQADAFRNALLAQKKLPIPTIEFGSGRARGTATLKCYGWWKTLEWQYYADALTTSLETTQQLSTMLGGAQYVTGVRIVDASGVASSRYRDGDGSIRKEAEDLLSSGTAGGRRLLARVNSQRLVEVYEEPALTSGGVYLMTTRGDVLTPQMQPVEPHTCPVGIWVTPKDVIPNLASLGSVASAPLFIDEAEFVPGKMSVTADERTLDVVHGLTETGGYRPRARGQRSPWDLTRIRM